jgi:hypothetical protein
MVGGEKNEKQNRAAPSCEMQGAAEGGHPKQTTPQRVGDAGQRSRSLLAASENFSLFFLRTNTMKRSNHA